MHRTCRMSCLRKLQVLNDRILCSWQGFTGNNERRQADSVCYSLRYLLYSFNDWWYDDAKRKKRYECKVNRKRNKKKHIFVSKYRRGKEQETHSGQQEKETIHYSFGRTEKGEKASLEEIASTHFSKKGGTSTLVLEHMSWTRIAKLFMFPHVTFGHPSSRKEEYRPFCYEVLLNKWGGRITVCRVMNALDSIFLWFKTMIRVTYRAAKNLCRDSCRASGFHVSSRLSRLTIFCQPQVPMPTTHVTNNSKLFTREQQMKLKKF